MSVALSFDCTRFDASLLTDEPLHLTVHSIPVPQDGVPDDARRVRMGRWKMLLVALICATPVVAKMATPAINAADALDTTSDPSAHFQPANITHDELICREL